MVDHASGIVTVLMLIMLTLCILTLIPMVIGVCLMVWDEICDYRRRARSLK